MVSYAAWYPSRHGIPHSKVSHSGTVRIIAIGVLSIAIGVLSIANRVLMIAIRVMMIAIRVMMIAIRVMMIATRVPAWVAEDVDVGRPEGQAL